MITITTMIDRKPPAANKNGFGDNQRISQDEIKRIPPTRCNNDVKITLKGKVYNDIRI